MQNDARLSGSYVLVVLFWTTSACCLELMLHEQDVRRVAIGTRGEVLPPVVVICTGQAREHTKSALRPQMRHSCFQVNACSSPT